MWCMRHWGIAGTSTDQSAERQTPSVLLMVYVAGILMVCRHVFFVILFLQPEYQLHGFTLLVRKTSTSTSYVASGVRPTYLRKQ